MALVVDMTDGVPNCAGALVPLISSSDVCTQVQFDDNANDDSNDFVYYFDDDDTTVSFKGKKGNEGSKVINPLPSVSTTPFPTTAQSTEGSQRVSCQASLAPMKAFSFKVLKQVRLQGWYVYCIVTDTCLSLSVIIKL